MYRYYRCHARSCKKTMRATELEQLVTEALLREDLPAQILPVLRRRVQARDRTENENRAGSVRTLRAERRRLQAELDQIRKAPLPGLQDKRHELEGILRATEWLLAFGSPEEPARGDDHLVGILTSLEERLRSADAIRRREALETVVERIGFIDGALRLTFSKAIVDVLETCSKAEVGNS